MGLFDRKQEKVTTFIAAAKSTLSTLQPLGLAATTRGVDSIGKLTRKAVRVKEPEIGRAHV